MQDFRKGEISILSNFLPVSLHPVTCFPSSGYLFPFIRLPVSLSSHHNEIFSLLLIFFPSFLPSFLPSCLVTRVAIKSAAVCSSFMFLYVHPLPPPLPSSPPITYFKLICFSTVFIYMVFFSSLFIFLSIFVSFLHFFPPDVREKHNLSLKAT